MHNAIDQAFILLLYVIRNGESLTAPEKEVAMAAILALHKENRKVGAEETCVTCGGTVTEPPYGKYGFFLKSCSPACDKTFRERLDNYDPENPD